VHVRFAAGATVAAGMGLQIGSLSFTFDEDINDGDVVVSVTGLTASVAGVVNLQGDGSFSLDAIGNIEAGFSGSLDIADLFEMSGTFSFVFDGVTEEIRVAGTGMAFSVNVAGTDLISFSNGVGGLYLTREGMAGGLSGDLSLLDGVPGVTMQANDFTAMFNTLPGEVNETFTVGDEQIVLNVPAGEYLLLQADNVLIDIAGVTMQGKVGFQREVTVDGEVMVVFFEDVSIAAFGGEGTGGSAISIEDAQGIFVIQPNVGLAGQLSFTATVALPGIDAGTEAKIFFNDTGAGIDMEGAFGTLLLPAQGPNNSTVWIEASVSFVFPGIEISGTFSFASSDSDGGSVVIIATQVEAFVGDNFSASRTGLMLTNGQGFFLDNGDGKIGFITGTVSFVGVDGLDVTATMTLRYNETTSAFSDTFIIAGEEFSVDFGATETSDGTDPFIQVIAEDVELNLLDVVGLGGDITVTRAPDTFTVTVTDAYAFLGDGPYKNANGTVNANAVGVVVNNLNAGMSIDTGSENGNFALYATGDAAIIGVDVLTLSGTLSVFVNNSGTQVVDFGGAIGNIDYGTASEMVAFIGANLQLDIAGFVSASGSISFTAADGVVSAAGEDIAVSLDVTNDIYARVNGVDFGLFFGEGQLGFETSGGTFELSMQPLGTATAESVTVRYTNNTTVVSSATTVGYGSVTYTFAEEIAANTVEFIAKGVSVGLLGIATLEGDFAFSLVNNDFVALAENVEAFIGTSTVNAGVTGGALALVYRNNALAIEASGGVFLNGGGFATATADLVRFGYNEAGMDVLGETFTIGTLSYTFAFLPAANDFLAVSVEGLDVNLLDVIYLRGDIGFSVNGETDEMQIVAQNVEVGLEAGPLRVGLFNGSLGMVIDSNNKLVLEAQGGFFAELGDLLELGADTVVLRVNETGNAYTGVNLNVAGLPYTFGTIGASTSLMELAVGGAEINIADFIVISGDFAIRLETTTVTLSDGQNVEVDVFTIGAGSVNAFAGFNYNQPDEVGLRLSEVDFGVGIFSETSGSRSWLALQGSVGELVVSGIPGITISMTNFGLEVNMEADDTTVIDFATTVYSVSTGPSSFIDFTMDGEDGALIQATGTIT
ncbi:MAG: hypothetical protein PF795_03005, partial [Kiritimatiellae bacterium]|nr:hypothetical protein [Kiritimatiellia bacterium]